MDIPDNSVLLFIGDSITDCGRAFPVGEGEGLGNGYVSLVNSLIGSACPEKKIRILNTGVSGNRITDLDARWENDVLLLKPDWVSVMIGINDVWRQFDHFLAPDQVKREDYKTIYRRLIEQTKKVTKGLVLMTPFYLEINKKDPMRKMMDEYSVVVKELSEEYNTVFVDVQGEFDALLAHVPTQALCGDRVHPNMTGHMVIAKSFLNAVGFRW